MKNFTICILSSFVLASCTTIGEAYVDTVDTVFATAFGGSPTKAKFENLTARGDTTKFHKLLDKIPADTYYHSEAIDPGLFDPIHYLTPLHMAVRANNLAVVEALIERGDSVNINARFDSEKHSTNLSPLMSAVTFGNVKITEALLKAGADVNAVDRNRSVEDFIKPEKNGVVIANALNRAGLKISSKKVAELKAYRPPTPKSNDSGFQWGKALALGVGAIAGGGLDLDTDTQASVISGIVLDSMKDTSGTSNLDRAVSDALKPVAAPSLSTVSNTSNEVGLAKGAETSETSSDIVQSDTNSGNKISTPTGSSNKCGISSYSLAEEQAEKDRLGAIMESKLVNVPAYDYKTRNQLWRDWESGMSAWRKARHEACGIDTNRTSRVTIE